MTQITRKVFEKRIEPHLNKEVKGNPIVEMFWNLYVKGVIRLVYDRKLKSYHIQYTT